jgi:pimeloyl-ACP methyl ester carboxylesterase
MKVSANGLQLEYDERGDPNAPVMLMIMGLGVQSIFWPERLCDLLAGAGFRVIRFDNRDAGLSTRLGHLGTPKITLEAIKYALHLKVRAPYTIDDMARDTLGLMDALGVTRAHVVGASMGGMIGQNLAVLAPDRVASLTSIMSTTGSRKVPPPTAAARRALMAAPARDDDLPGAITRLIEVLRAIGSRTYPMPDDELRAYAERQVHRAHYPAGGMRQLVAIAGSGDRTPVVRKIRAPTLVLHGDEDPLVRPPGGEATAAAIRAGGGQATLEMIRGMGHDFPAPLIPRIVDLITLHARRHA